MCWFRKKSPEEKILKTLRRSKEALTIYEIAKRTKLVYSQVHRIVYKLKTEDKINMIKVTENHRDKIYCSIKEEGWLNGLCI